MLIVDIVGVVLTGIGVIFAGMGIYLQIKDRGEPRKE